MKWLLAGVLVICGVLSVLPAAGALQNLFLAHPDSRRWVYWAVGLPFAALSVVLFLLAALVLWAPKQRG